AANRVPCRSSSSRTAAKSAIPTKPRTAPAKMTTRTRTSPLPSRSDETSAKSVQLWGALSFLLRFVPPKERNDASENCYCAHRRRRTCDGCLQHGSRSREGRQFGRELHRERHERRQLLT